MKVISREDQKVLDLSSFARHPSFKDLKSFLKSVEDQYTEKLNRLTSRKIDSDNLQDLNVTIGIRNELGYLFDNLEELLLTHVKESSINSQQDGEQNTPVDKWSLNKWIKTKIKTLQSRLLKN